MRGINKFIIDSVPGGFLLHEHRVGMGVSMGLMAALSYPADYLIDSVIDTFFSKGDIEAQRDESFLEGYGIKQISTKNELARKVSKVVLTLALFIPIALSAKFALARLGFNYLAFYQTPILTLFAEEAMGAAQWLALGHVLGTILNMVNAEDQPVPLKIPSTPSTQG